MQLIILIAMLSVFASQAEAGGRYTGTGTLKTPSVRCINNCGGRTAPPVGRKAETTRARLILAA